MKKDYQLRRFSDLTLEEKKRYVKELMLTKKEMKELKIK